jgi:hypothetical protein
MQNGSRFAATQSASAVHSTHPIAGSHFLPTPVQALAIEGSHRVAVDPPSGELPSGDPLVPPLVPPLVAPLVPPLVAPLVPPLVAPLVPPLAPLVPVVPLLDPVVPASVPVSGTPASLPQAMTSVIPSPTKPTKQSPVRVRMATSNDDPRSPVAKSPRCFQHPRG